MAVANENSFSQFFIQNATKYDQVRLKDSYQCLIEIDFFLGRMGSFTSNKIRAGEGGRGVQG